MKKNININRIISFLLIFPFIFGMLSLSFASNSNDIIYPLKQVAKLSCRFQNFKELGSNCKENLPILHTKDYKKYIKLNGGYNDYTRYYTTLWGASYKYGWDVGLGGHEGVDIATSKGTPVYSIARGKIITARRELGWGNVVVIEHFIRGKKVFSDYAHMSKILVRKGQNVYAGTKIGEVGSEGNSTGNHLHFQIDLDTPFHPFYYSRKTCPYSYNKITETGICFNELASSTIDPLLFIETQGKILDHIKQLTNKISRSNFGKTIVTNSNKYIGNFMDIFNRTVYKGYGERNIKNVQKVFQTLGYYKGIIDGKYSRLEQDIIRYQLDKKIINSRNDNGAGWFGPKTRAQAKKDYLRVTGTVGQKTTNFGNTRNISAGITFQKIGRNNILTRAEIEKREINDFLRQYNINLSLSSIGGNVTVGSSINLNIEIKSKSKKRYFRGNTPLSITFPVNNKNISVFPTKIFDFSDGRRTARITGKKVGTSLLQVRLGSKILKTFSIKVTKVGKLVYPYSARILGNSRIVYGDVKKGIIVMRDKNNRNLINLRYGSSFKIKGNSDTLVCIKRGSLRNIVKIFKSNCKLSNFKHEINFDYNSTVGGLVLFEYKVIGNNPKIEVINNYKNLKLASKNIYVSNPKDIKANYVYKNDVISMLQKNIVTGINRGYFLYNRNLTAGDAIKWIENTLIKLKQNSVDSSIIKKIDNNLEKLRNERILKYKSITRQKFLELIYEYINLDNSKGYTSRNYRDLDSTLNREVGAIFGKKITWKDKFGKNYFRPNTYINRGEAAFVLNNVYNNNQSYFLTLK